MHSFDMFVIGTGPSGQKAAIQAAKLGKSVGICERRQSVGGVCINVSTIPSKTFREAALYLNGFYQRGLYGSSFTVKEDVTMEDLVFRCQHVIRIEVDVIRLQMRRNGVHVLEGEASFVDSNHLVLHGSQGAAEVEADNIVIATGTQPSLPKDIGIDGHTTITSDGILDIDTIPHSMTVVGAGVIGIEYASIFASLGVEVTVVDMRKQVLEFVDSELIESLIYQMRNMNCIFRLGEEVESIQVERPHRAVAMLKSGKRITSELLLYATGREGATSELNLKAAGLKTDERGRIKVNEHYQTEQPHIYAVGDVIGFPSLASASMEQGRLAACNIFGIKTTSTPELFPYAIYSVPEISMVGKTEEELTEKAVPYEIGVARYREIARGNIMGDDTGLLKLLFHQETRKILGVHIIGTGASELIHIGQTVLAFDGTIDYFVNNVFNYPTFAECYKVAALDGYNKIGPPQDEAPPPDSE